MTEAAIGSIAAREELSPAAKKAIAGAFFGLAVDFYDIYLPTVALTPAIIYFLPKNLPASVVATLNFIAFSVAIIGRPIGAFIFGHLGDVIGRRRTTMIAVAGFAILTFLIALLPGYATWGYGAIALLIVLRLVDGIFMGGEYTSANPLALEACPKHLRGFVGGLIQAAYPIAYVAIALTVTIMLGFVPAGTVDSPYVQWGWRIPFVIGAILGLAVLAFYARVEESRLWETEAAERVKAPLKDLFAGQNLRNLAQVFLMMSGLWFSVQLVISATPGLLENVLKQPARGVTNGLLVANVCLVAGYFIAALLGQRFGRRLILIVSGVWTAIPVPLFYYLMLRNARSGGTLLMTMVLYTIALCLAISPWGIVTTYINERFPTGVRASGYGIGYSLAAIIPSFFSIYMLALRRLMPFEYTPLVLIVLAGLLQIIGAWLGPETRHVDLAGVLASGTPEREPQPRVAPG
jgi:MFS family permease